MAKGEATLLIKIKEMGSEAIDKVQESIGALKAFATVAFAAITAVVYKSIDAYREQEEATNKLSQAMANAGIFSNELRQKYDEQAKALQKITTYADEQITSAQAILQAFTGGREVTEELTKATLNLAAAKKMDLNAAADLVGKTIGSNTNILSRQGVQFDNNTRGAERLSAVIEALNSKFGGQAEAAAKGLGSLKQLENVTGDIFEVMGDKLAPLVAVVTSLFISMAESAQKNEGIFSGFSSILTGFLSITNRVASGLHLLTQMVSGVIGTLVGAGDLLIRGQFKAAKAAMATGLAEIATQMEQNVIAMQGRQTALDEADTNRQKEKLEADLLLLEESLRKKAEVKLAADEAEFIALQEQKLMQMEADNALIGANQEQEFAAYLAHLNKKISAEDDAHKKSKLMREKEEALKFQALALRAKQELDLTNMTTQAKLNILQGAANLATALAGRESKAAFVIQQASALAGTFVATKLAAAQALASPPGPPATIPLAGYVETAGYLNMAAIAATTLKGLASGGVVPATQGGTPFILGEGGRDEAVIPLENGGVPGMGTNVHIHVGAMMGTQAEAREFAVMIDRELLTLRQQNQSVSMESLA